MEHSNGADEVGHHSLLKRLLCRSFQWSSEFQSEKGLPIPFTQDMRTWGKKKKWCPYFLARHMLTIANVVVYNYQYMLDPKVRNPERPVRWYPEHPLLSPVTRFA